MTDKNKSIMFDEDGNPNDLGIAKIIYSGYQNNCINKNVEAAISFDDFSKWVDQTILTTEGSDLLRDVLKVWADSVEIQDLIKAPIEKKSQEQTDQPITEESSQQ
jgi:hypothetical protein